MMFSQLYCDAWIQDRVNPEIKKDEPLLTPITITSSMFPAYLPVGKSIRFPTYEELVTETSAKFEKATQTEYEGKYYLRASNSVFPKYETVQSEPDFFSFRITNASTGEEVPVTDFTATLNESTTYKATYLFVYSDAGDFVSLYYTEYSYTFSAVKNRLPLKPWTVKDVVERILDCAIPLYSNGTDSTEYSRRYTLDPDQEAWLDTVDGTALRRAPEFTMTRCTLREMLQVVGGFIHAEPRLITKMHKDEDGNPVIDGQYIHFDRYGETKQSEAANTPYVYRRKFRDINQFCTAVDSITDNMVNSIKWARGSIVAPRYGQGLCVHTETQYLRVNDTNGIVPTDFPIQRIKRVLCGAWMRKENRWAVGMTDITSFVVESTAYNANLSSYDGTYPYSKSYAIYYTMGQKNLQGLYFREPTASTVSLKNWAIVNILAMASDWDADDLQKDTGLENCPFDFYFQIEYDPIYSSHISHGKQDLPDTASDFSQISNQSENLIEVQFYGENIKGIAARLGQVEEARTCKCCKLSEIPKVGEMMGDLAISSVSVAILPNFIKYTVTLTKDFNRISRYIGVNSVKRIYEVSERQTYQRDTLMREYCVFSVGSTPRAYEKGIFRDPTDIASAFVTTYAQKRIDRVVCRMSSKTHAETHQTVQLPVIASSLGNVANYSWRYADNFSAGAQVYYRSADGISGAWQTDVAYSDYYGRGWWYEFAMLRESGSPDSFATSAETGAAEITAAMDLPAVSPNAFPDAEGFGTNGYGRLLLRKDSREALSFTAQLEFKSATPGLIIGSEIAKRLSSVAGNTEQNARVYFLTESVNKFDTYFTVTDGTASLDISVSVGENGGTIKANSTIPGAAGTKYAAWVIATPPKVSDEIQYQDEDGTVKTYTDMTGGHILLARNIELTAGTPFPTIYFQLAHDIFK